MIKYLLPLLIFSIPTKAESWDMTAPDKKLHIAAGAISYTGARLLGLSQSESLALGLLAGFAKEAWDRKHPPHTSEFSDFTATAIGTGLIFTMDKRF